jgi:hypothetical protein
VIEHLPSTYRALDSIPDTTKKKKERKKIRGYPPKYLFSKNMAPKAKPLAMHGRFNYFT